VGELGGLGRLEQFKTDGMPRTVLDVTGSVTAIQDERCKTLFMVVVPEGERDSLRPGLVVEIVGDMQGGVLRGQTVGFSGGTARPRVERWEESHDSIQHVLFVLPANHLFDNYFGTFPRAEGLPPNLTVQGAASYYLSCFRSGNLAHGRSAVLTAVPGGAMGKIRHGGALTRDNGLLRRSRHPQLLAYDRFITTADKFFSFSSRPSLPNHLFALAAGAGGETINRVIPTARGPRVPEPARAP